MTDRVIPCPECRGVITASARVYPDGTMDQIVMDECATCRGQRTIPDRRAVREAG